MVMETITPRLRRASRTVRSWAMELTMKCLTDREVVYWSTPCSCSSCLGYATHLACRSRPQASVRNHVVRCNCCTAKLAAAELAQDGVRNAIRQDSDRKMRDADRLGH